MAVGFTHLKSPGRTNAVGLLLLCGVVEASRDGARAEFVAGSYRLAQKPHEFVCLICGHASNRCAACTAGSIRRRIRRPSSVICNS
jgi:hypothetical protein